MHPRLSPNGDRFAIDILNDFGVKDVYVYVFEIGFVGNQTHDGMSIMSAWRRNGGPTARHYPRVREITGAGARGLFPRSEAFTGILYADSWTSDGQTLVLTHRIGGESSELWSYRRGDAEPRLLSNRSTRPGSARFRRTTAGSHTCVSRGRSRRSGCVLSTRSASR